MASAPIDEALQRVIDEGEIDRLRSKIADLSRQLAETEAAARLVREKEILDIALKWFGEEGERFARFIKEVCNS